MKKLEYTPRSKIQAAIRRMSRFSREFNKFRKEYKFCSKCHASGKLELHHTKRPDWDRIINVIREEILNTAHLIALCPKCHEVITKEQRATSKKRRKDSK
jgi:uncharacterized protein with PIN domain